ncbi:MAG TPA: hypothetical protein VF829_02400, partial [Candidatus Paceibacterota bacterium]
VAATASAARDLVFSTSSMPAKRAAIQNIYLAGESVSVAAPAPADLSVAGGSVSVSAPVMGDLAALGGSVSLRGTVQGDARMLGGNLLVEAPVAGDLAVLGASVDDRASDAKDILAAGGSVHLGSGSRGPVSVYGGEISLAGTFDGDVRAVALDKLVLAPGTVIHGSLQYEASEAATIPDSVQVDGGVRYTGSTFLPTAREAQAFVMAGIGILFLVRILGALIIAGLFAGLFPKLTNDVAREVLDRPARHVLALMLLGLGIIVFAPALMVLLALTFVGIGLAFILGAAYLLLLLVSFAYAGILIGAIFARVFMKRQEVSWHDALFGMLVLVVIGSVPVLGGLVTALLVFLSMGALAVRFRAVAFSSAEQV